MEKQTTWVKFTWQLKNLAGSKSPVLKEGYECQTATTGHFKEILETVVGAYETEPVWEKTIRDIKIRMMERVGNTLGQGQNKYLIILKDSKIVAVSGVCQYHWTDQNFLTGICVSKTHQRNGIGTYLLFESLRSLHALGLDTVNVFTEENSLADIKIYPLFQSSRVENVHYLSLDMPLHQSPIVHNVYYQGNVQSLGLDTHSSYVTAGVIKPGNYQFEPTTKEKVVIIKGRVEVRLPDQDWIMFEEKDFYEVPSGVTFTVRNLEDVLYVCYYN